MDLDSNRSSLFAVIPAAVMRDNRLRANAKLLYGEITALARASGYCWAENAHFAEILDISTKTVSELISQLQKCGHIQVEVERDSQNHAVLARKLWVVGPPGMEAPPPPKNRGTSPEKSGDLPRKIGGPPPKNQPALYDEEIKENNPIAPMRGSSVSMPKWLPAEFEQFWKVYRTRCRGENRQGAVRAWDKLRPDEALIAEIYRALWIQLETPDWKRGIGIPYCSTYLNGRRWEDVDDSAAPGSDSGEGGADGWEN